MPPTSQPPTKGNQTRTYGIFQTVFPSVLEVVYQTRKTVFDHISKHQEDS